MTSHDVVARVRRALGTRKVGHAGTLDPMATGVLVLLFGEATKLSEVVFAETLRRYGAAVAVVALALLLRRLITPLIGDTSPYLFVLTAVVISDV